MDSNYEDNSDHSGSSSSSQNSSDQQYSRTPTPIRAAYSSVSGNSDQSSRSASPRRAYLSDIVSESSSDASNSQSTVVSGSKTQSNLPLNESTGSASPAYSRSSRQSVTSNKSDSSMCRSSIESRASYTSYGSDSSTTEDRDMSSDEKSVAAFEHGKDGQREEEPEREILDEKQKLSLDLGNELYLVKLPDCLSINTRPFEEKSYSYEIDKEEIIDGEGQARAKFRVENTIRWREVVESNEDVVRESNTKLVKWSDGSKSLHLGSQILDVDQQRLAKNKEQLFVRNQLDLDGQGVFGTRLSFRPHSTESVDQSNKTSTTKINNKRKRPLEVFQSDSDEESED